MLGYMYELETTEPRCAPQNPICIQEVVCRRGVTISMHLREASPLHSARCHWKATHIAGAFSAPRCGRCHMIAMRVAGGVCLVSRITAIPLVG